MTDKTRSSQGIELTDAHTKACDSLLLQKQQELDLRENGVEQLREQVAQAAEKLPNSAVYKIMAQWRASPEFQMDVPIQLPFFCTKQLSKPLRPDDRVMHRSSFRERLVRTFAKPLLIAGLMIGSVAFPVYCDNVLDEQLKIGYYAEVRDEQPPAFWLVAGVALSIPLSAVGILLFNPQTRGQRYRQSVIDLNNGNDESPTLIASEYSHISEPTLAWKFQEIEEMGVHPVLCLKELDHNVVEFSLYGSYTKEYEAHLLG